MKNLIILSVVAAIASAKPSNFISYSASVPSAFNTAHVSTSSIIHAAPAAIKTAPILVAPISSQYHSQDTFGQYAFGYSSPLSAQDESKSIDGITRGGYTYVDAHGKVQTVSYVSDAFNGFRVAATNLPIAPIHNAVPPMPVQDTPEVVAARTAHLVAKEEAKTKVEAINAIDSVETTAAKIVHEKTHVIPSAYSYSSYITHRPGFTIVPAFASYAPIISDAVTVEAKSVPHFASIHTKSLPISVLSTAPIYKFGVIPGVPAETAEVVQAKTTEGTKVQSN